ncbi:MAG TPA: hypothetical protein VFG68_18210 [Fimbriiglobus sp.]|nr:hypothetical protein [Fimbriiglobus sp.]
MTSFRVVAMIATLRLIRMRPRGGTTVRRHAATKFLLVPGPAWDSEP